MASKGEVVTSVEVKQQRIAGQAIVVVAVDNSANAEQSLQYYLKHVHTRGNKLVFVFCMEMPYLGQKVSFDTKNMTPDEVRETRREVIAQLADENTAEAREIECRYKKLADSLGITSKIVWDFAEPGPFILKVAEEEKANLIVMGRRGQSKMRRTILGSVSDFVLHHSDCPVMIQTGEAA